MNHGGVDVAHLLGHHFWASALQELADSECMPQHLGVWIPGDRMALIVDGWSAVTFDELHATNLGQRDELRYPPPPIMDIAR